MLTTYFFFNFHYFIFTYTMKTAQGCCLDVALLV